jgi:PAS domain S-box-containing protein
VKGYPWRIMIVEDKPAHVEAIKRALVDSGQAVEIQVAGSLQEYRTMVADKPPDITLMDLNLPDGNAMEVLTFPPETALFPILIMTSYGSEQIAVEALKAGALDYVVKSPEAFAAISHTLERARREWTLLQERKWAQEALREHQLRLQLALDAAEAGVWHWNVQTGEIYWDDRMQTIFGLEPGTFSGTLEAWLAQVHPEDQSAALKGALEALEQNRPYNFEYRVLGLNQEWRLVNVQALLIRDETGQPVKLAGLCRDISARRRMEQSLRESEEKYRLLFENAPLGIMHYDQEGVVTDCNEKFAEILGASRQKIFGFNLARQLCDENMRHAAMTALAGQPGYFEGDYISTIAGKPTSIRAFFQPVLSPAGEVVGGVSIFEDVSEKKRAEVEKQKLEAQLFQAQKMEAIGTLAGGIAHDFNNILAAIMGYTEMAAYSLNDAPRAENYLEQVLTASLRAKNLVDQILTLGRKLESEKKPVSLKLVIQDVLQLLLASLPRTIEIQQHLLSHTPILADATQIHQIILNLVTNAYHAMEETGGTLEISLVEVQIESPVPANLKELKPGLYMKLQVRDTGPGIDPDILPRIFEPYFTTKEVGKGNGLGLAIVLGITKSHGGEIVVDSIPGQGTTFTIYFPQLIATRPTSSTIAPSDLTAGTGHILIVDDEPALADLWAAALNRLGYETTKITNSLEAMEIFSAHPEEFDLVITDLVMPELTGLELVRKARTIRPDITIIACTGYSERFGQEEIMELGIKAVLKKPLEVRQLAEVVKQVLGSRAGKEFSDEDILRQPQGDKKDL